MASYGMEIDDERRGGKLLDYVITDRQTDRDIISNNQRGKIEMKIEI